MSAFAAFSVSSNLERYQTRISVESPMVTYIGKAAPGVATSASKWNIQRHTYDGDNLVVEWASGTAFSSVWDDRLSLTYT